jgi:hypothetical protein
MRIFQKRFSVRPDCAQIIFVRYININRNLLKWKSFEIVECKAKRKEKFFSNVSMNVREKFFSKVSKNVRLYLREKFFSNLRAKVN